MRTLPGPREKFALLGFAIISALLVAIPISHAMESDPILLWWSNSIEPDVSGPIGRPIFVSIQVKHGSGNLADHIKALHDQYALQNCSSREDMKYPITYNISCMVPDGHQSFWQEFLVKLPWVDSISLNFGENYEVSTDVDLPIVLHRKIPSRVAIPTFDPVSTFRTVKTLLKDICNGMRKYCQKTGRECVEVAPDGEDYIKISIRDSKGIILPQYRYWERLTIEASLYYGGNIKLRLDAQFASGMNDDREPPISSFYPMEYKFPHEINEYLKGLTDTLSKSAREQGNEKKNSRQFSR